MSYSFQNNLKDSVTLQALDLSNNNTPVSAQIAAGGLSSQSHWDYVHTWTVDGIVFDTYPVPSGQYASLTNSNPLLEALYAYGFVIDGNKYHILQPQPKVATLTASQTPGATLQISTYATDSNWAITLQEMSKGGGGGGGGPGAAPKKNSHIGVYIGVGVALVVVFIVVIAYNERKK